jgi:hypothetical protein
MKTYHHRGIEFRHGGGLYIYTQKFLPLKKQLNNGVLSWKLNRNTWLSINQLREIIKNKLSISSENNVNCCEQTVRYG